MRLLATVLQGQVGRGGRRDVASVQPDGVGGKGGRRLYLRRLGGRGGRMWREDARRLGDGRWGSVAKLRLR